MLDPAALGSLFYDSLSALGKFTPVEADALPQVYKSLLAHEDHMTVTVEAWHNSLVDVGVLRKVRDGDCYAREILLTRQRDGGVVQYGIMRINLLGLPEIVRLEIESQALPLGRILIRHHVLRQVELVQLWQVKPAAALRLAMKLESDEDNCEDIYGRTARILVEGKPAVELLEIVTR